MSRQINVRGKRRSPEELAPNGRGSKRAAQKSIRESIRLAIVIASVTTALAQLPAPGQPSQGPPAQPGQLGSGSKSNSSDPSDADASTTKEQQAMPPGTPSDYTIRSNVQNVLVPTTVLDPDGHGYVNGLTVKDFEVLDNGKAQKVNSELTQQPVSVVLAVQANAEVEPLLPTMKKSGLLLQGLVTGQEGDAAILAFDHRMQVLQDFTNDPGKLDDAMHKITAGSSSAALIDAVLYADRMLKRHDPHNNRRRVILLMSRDVNKGSESKLPETIRDMQFDNIIVYCVDISKVKTALLSKPGYPGPQNGRQPAAALPNITGQTMTDTNVVQQENGNALEAIPPIYRGIRDLFKKTPAQAFTYFTGGQIYSFSNQKGLETAITDIGKDLNSQYLLSYNPSQETKEEPGFHNIRVIVDRPGLKIRTRPGYWWGGGQTQ
jgi:VWFA-related protein